MKENSKLEPFYKIGLVVLIIVVILVAIYQINYLREYKNVYDTFAEAQKRHEAMLTEIGEKHKELLKQNSDYVGWLDILGTNIQYPMVQGKDNEKYLNIDFNGNVDSNASIFVDNKVSNPFEDKVTVIHGSSKMFGDLTKFEDRQFSWSGYGAIDINLDGKQETYFIFSIFYDEGNVEEYKYNFNGEDELREYVDYLA